MISHMINSFLLGILFVEMLDRRFPSGVSSLFISFSYNMIYIYSKFQILFLQFNNSLNKFIENEPFLFEIKNKLDLMLKSNQNGSTIQYIKNGEIINGESLNYDFAIYSDFNKNNNCINKKIITKNNLITPDYDISSIQFILVEIIVGENKIFKINLKTNDYNFYIVDNVISKDFIAYYLKNIHEPSFDIYKDIHKEDKIMIKIIDHDVNNVKFELNATNEQIIIKKTDYILNIVNNLKFELIDKNEIN